MWQETNIMRKCHVGILLSKTKNCICVYIFLQKQFLPKLTFCFAKLKITTIDRHVTTMTLVYGDLWSCSQKGAKKPLKLFSLLKNTMFLALFSSFHKMSHFCSIFLLCIFSNHLIALSDRDVARNGTIVKMRKSILGSYFQQSKSFFLLIISLEAIFGKSKDNQN